MVEKETILTRIINGIFALGLLVTAILYPIGFREHNDFYKVPIYILLTLVFAVLTYRGFKLLHSWKIILVPFFSVGVNLGFIFLLDKYGGNPYTDPRVAANALFHILHDLIGTEAGVGIFTWLVYDIGIAKLKDQDQVTKNTA